jgi:hypothetical protein
LAAKPEKQGTLGRPRHRWKVDIKMNVTEVGWENVDWIYVAQYMGQW